MGGFIMYQLKIIKESKKDWLNLHVSVTLPDDSTSSGNILGIQNFFGDLTITVNGEIVSCSVENEKQWAQKIMDIITQYKTK